MFEREPVEKLTSQNQLMAFKHHDFWQCMDTLMNKRELDKLWATHPKWKVWD